MKRILCAAMVGLASAAVNAQSSVTVFGLLDVGATFGRGSVANITQMNAGNLIASRIGFRGTEDLGGGLSANFWLEAGINNDSGTFLGTNTNNQASGVAGGGGMMFGRQAWVGLSGPWGQVRFGRDWTPSFMTYIKYDVANGGGTGTTQAALGSIGAYGNPAGLRASNAFEYLSPLYSGFQVHLMYALGENPSTAGVTRKDGNYAGGRVSYVSGPLDASIAYAKYSLSTVGNIQETIVGATYAFTPIKLHGMFTRNTTGSASDMRGYLLGVSYPFGTNEVRASVSTSHVENAAGVVTGDVRKYTLMAMHYMSKRTQLYAVYAYDKNKNGATAVPFPGYAVTGPGRPASALSLGVVHAF